MDTLELYTEPNGDHRWRLRAAENGNILADSGEGYRRRRKMLKTAARVLGLVVDAGSDAPLLAGYEYPRRDGTRVRVIEV